MRIGKKFIIPAVCVAAFTVFGQGQALVGKTVEELKKQISLGSVVTTDYRDNQNQKWELLKTTSEQDKDMGFEGVMRLTVELTGNNGEVWYGQQEKPQGKKRADYIGSDTWEFRVPHGTLKYPEMVYAVEYGYKQTNKTFVAVGQQFRKVNSAEEIMARNKDSKNKLKITPKTRAEHETADAAAE
jgi:hypothetical protein